MKAELLAYGPRRIPGRLAVVATAAFVVGGALLVWSADIHFVLWHSVGYRHIPTIGPLFILQSVAGLLLGLLVVAVRRVWAAVVAAGFALSTVGGFLLTVLLPRGLFNYKESWLAPFAKQAFGIEIAAAAVLLAGAALCLGRAGRSEA
jgi:hypothetical protein